MNKRLHITPEICIGCKTCELACSFRHMEKNHVPGTRCIHVVEAYPKQYFQMVCLQCEDAACVKTCPVQAIFKNDKTGAIEIHQNKCVQCKACVMACPFGNIVIHENTLQVIKCDLCEGDPLCAKYCPSKALQYVEINQRSVRNKTG